jgi:hypothetical protein
MSNLLGGTGDREPKFLLANAYRTSRHRMIIAPYQSDGIGWSSSMNRPGFELTPKSWTLKR